MKSLENSITKGITNEISLIKYVVQEDGEIKNGR